jgi:hypothetical protein
VLRLIILAVFAVTPRCRYSSLSQLLCLSISLMWSNPLRTRRRTCFRSRCFRGFRPLQFFYKGLDLKDFRIRVLVSANFMFDVLLHPADIAVFEKCRIVNGLGVVASATKSYPQPSRHVYFFVALRCSSLPFVALRCPSWSF